jgi:Sulfite exporter TauE/SafE
MIRGRRGADDRPAPRDLPLARVIVYGVLVGLVAGLIGAGGGFLVVPALALLGGLAMPASVGTSLLVIAMQSLAGFAGHLATTTLYWGLAAAVTTAAIAGALIGARLAGRVRPEALVGPSVGLCWPCRSSWSSSRSDRCPRQCVVVDRYRHRRDGRRARRRSPSGNAVAPRCGQRRKDTTADRVRSG